jgi:hypothetical protein
MSVLKMTSKKLGAGAASPAAGDQGETPTRRWRKWATGAVAVSLIGSGAAFAYWSAGGSGDGDAQTDTTSQSVVVNQTSTITGLAPGLGAQTLSGDFDNPNSGPVHVGAVSVVVTGTDTPGCGPTDYTIGGSAPVNAQVAAGDGVGSWSGLTIAFNNKAGVNQDACKGAVVELAYSSN